MLNEPTISIVIPVYNVDQYLAKCMDSLLSQTLREMEFILVDDGSEDESGALCDQYAQMDPRVHVFHKANGGVSSARNEGLKHVRGQYLAFVDPDDWVEPYAFERLVCDAQTHQADVVFFGYDEVLESESESGVIVHSPQMQGEGDAREGIRQMMLGIGKGYFTLIANKMMRTELCIKADGSMHGFDETIAVGEDGLWLVDVIMKANRVYFDPTVFYHWRIRADSACHVKQLTTARLSAIAAQQRIIGKISCYGAEIEQLFLWIVAYRQKDKAAFGRIQAEIVPYRGIFFREKEISSLRKLKTLVCIGLMSMHVHPAFVERIITLTMHQIRSMVSRKRLLG